MTHAGRLQETAPCAWAPLGLAVGVMAPVYGPELPELVADWTAHPNLSHGFAVPVIAAYLAWQRRSDLLRLDPAPTWSGLPLVVAAFGLYLLGTFGGEPFLARISLLPALLGSVLLLGGWGQARVLMPSIGYLAFMIPLPYLALKQVTDSARQLDASAAALALPWLGVPVLRDGYYLYLPNTTLEVADVCSSIPAVAALLSLGAGLGLARRRSRGHTLILLFASAPLGVLSNIVRITLTGAGVHYFGPWVLATIPHLWSGTTVFLATFGALVLLDRVLRTVTLAAQRHQ